jgi:hypothetical protein
VFRGAILAAILAALAVGAAQAAGEPALLFVMTGQSNAGQQGRPGQVAAGVTAPVAGAYYRAPQHTKVQSVVAMQPWRGAFGPELSFARAIRAACPGREVVVAKVYLGGASIINWNPDAPNSQWKYDLAQVGNAGNAPQYPRVLDAASQAAARFGRPVELAGLLWVQAERDSRYDYGATRYEGNWRRLVAALRSEWGAPALPFVAMDSHTQLDSGGAAVHEALVDVAATMPAVGWAETRDLGTSDGIHFDSDGVVTLGQRLAAEWLRLAGGCG